MKLSLISSLIASLAMVLLIQLVSTDAAALATDDRIASMNSNVEQMFHSPVRRHHLKFGVLGKRNDELDEKLQEELNSWLNNWRERRANSRPLYGLLG